jgi:hypothetical protein
MRRTTIVALLFASLLTAAANAQQLRFLVIDGKATPPTILQTNLAPADRPTVARTMTGAFTLRFPFPVQFFSGDVQLGAPGFDAGLSLFSAVFDPTNLRVLQVRTFGLNPGGTGVPVSMFPANGRMSIVVVR